MPELSSAVGYRLQPQVFQPIAPSSYFNKELPVQPAIPVDKAAKAGVFSSLVKALGELPGQLTKEWETGKKRGTSELVRQKFDTALKSGDDSQLSNFSVDANGNVLFKPEKKDDTDLLAAKKAYYEALKTKAENAGTGGKPNLHQKISSMFDGGTSGVSGGVSGLPEPELPTHDGETLNSDPFSPETLPQPDGNSTLHPGEVPTDDTGELSSFASPDPSAPAAVAAAPAAPAPDANQQIDAGVQNAVGQLSGIDAGSLLASNNDAGQPADIKPAPEAPTMAIDPATGQPPVKKAMPVAGRTVNHKTGEIYLSNADGSVLSKDPITQEIRLKTADGRKFNLLPGANQWKEQKDTSASSTKPSVKLIQDAAGLNINTDGMSNGQITEAINAKEKAEGVIRQSRLPAAQGLARWVMNHPTLKHYPTIREAKEAVDSGLANPDTGGFGDMALVEGFQRMVNPGATVRSQTMQQMLKAAGLGQYADLGFVLDHFTEGQKFNDATRKRLSKLANDIYERTTKNMVPQLKGAKALAKSYGITDPDSFIDNVMTMAPVLSGAAVEGGTPGAQAAAPVTPGTAPATAAKVRMTKPDGTVILVPADKVEQAKGLGATLAK